MTKTMTPEEFEKWIQGYDAKQAADMTYDILSKFRTVKWERTCEGCGHNVGTGVCDMDRWCSRMCEDHYTPAKKEKV